MIKDMTFGEAWSARAALARGPAANRLTPEYMALTAQIKRTSANDRQHPRDLDRGGRHD